MKKQLLLTIGMGFSLMTSVASANDSNTEPTSGLSQGVAVYNQAYIEDYDEADNIDAIIQATQPDKIFTDSFEAGEVAQQSRGAYVLVDPFMDGIAEKIPALQANGNEVGCYISIGTGEDWRADFSDLQPYLVSKQWGEWAGEYFVKNTDTGILVPMKARIDKLAQFGCNWVEFDNMDWFTDEDYISEYGIEVTEAQGIDYYQKLCTYAREQGILCMAKNTVVDADEFSGVLYESYENEKNWWDSDGAKAFLYAGKLVIINHYGASNPDAILQYYINQYNDKISFISESTVEEKYIHYAQQMRLD